MKIWTAAYSPFHVFFPKIFRCIMTSKIPIRYFFKKKIRFKNHMPTLSEPYITIKYNLSRYAICIFVSLHNGLLNSKYMHVYWFLPVILYTIVLSQKISQITLFAEKKKQQKRDNHAFLIKEIKLIKCN